MVKDKYIVYCATSPSGKKYIGITKESLKARMRGHNYKHKTHKHRSKFFDALKKYGFDNFTWEILETTNDTDELNALEIYYIREWGTLNNGYNMIVGGSGWGGLGHTEESKLKISSTLKNREPLPPITEETRAKMSRSAKNKPPVSEETRAKMSAAQKNKVFTIEYRLKLSIAQKRIRNNKFKEYIEAKRKIIEEKLRLGKQYRLFYGKKYATSGVYYILMYDASQGKWVNLYNLKSLTIFCREILKIDDLIQKYINYKLLAYHLDKFGFYNFMPIELDNNGLYYYKYRIVHIKFGDNFCMPNFIIKRRDTTIVELKNNYNEWWINQSAKYFLFGMKSREHHIIDRFINSGCFFKTIKTGKIFTALNQRVITIYY